MTYMSGNKDEDLLKLDLTRALSTSQLSLSHFLVCQRITTFQVLCIIITLDAVSKSHWNAYIFLSN